MSAPLLSDYLEAAILFDMWDGARGQRDKIWVARNFDWVTTGEFTSPITLIEEDELEQAFLNLEKRGYVEGIHDPYARSRWLISDKGISHAELTLIDPNSLITKYQKLGIIWIREVFETFKGIDAPNTNINAAETETNSMFDPVDGGEVVRDAKSEPITDDDGIPLIISEQPSENGKWDEAKWDQAKWADDPDSWKKPDTVGELSSESVEQIKSLIDQAIKELPKVKLSNEDQSQAMARLEAAQKLANAPMPPWGKVKELLEPMSQMAGVGSLIVAIIALIIVI